MTNEAGIDAKVFVIHGYPGENAETTEETISLLEDLGAGVSRASLFRFVPLPGTQVYDQADLHGIRGTHLQAGWDGNWAKFHIHHNDTHWWGSAQDWQEVESSHTRLRTYIESRWNPQG